MQDEINRILDSYPRKRPELSERNRLVYRNHYASNRSSDGFFNQLRSNTEVWMHKQLARSIRSVSPSTILEIGAGNLNHIPWESGYSSYDIVEPKRYLYSNSKDLCRVRSIYSDISDIPKGYYYDAVISIACLEHVDDLPDLIRKVRTHMRKGSCFVAAVPCEGELAWYLAWRLITGPIYRLKYNSSYSNVMRHEHINSLHDIETVLRHFFGDIKAASFPLHIKNFRLYCVYQCTF